MVKLLGPGVFPDLENVKALVVYNYGQKLYMQDCSFIRNTIIILPTFYLTGSSFAHNDSAHKKSHALEHEDGLAVYFKMQREGTSSLFLFSLVVM